MLGQNFELVNSLVSILGAHKNLFLFVHNTNILIWLYAVFFIVVYPMNTGEIRMVVNSFFRFPCDLAEGVSCRPPN